MKVVVTGGAGFIGSNLCRRLAAKGIWDEVVAFDDLSSGSAGNLAGVNGVDLIVGSILDEASLSRALSGAKAIVHLAARPSVPRSLLDPLTSNEINVTGTLRVLEGARRLDACHVIVASSSSVYGSNPTMPKHEQLVPQPMSPYAVSKLASEAYALAFAASFNMATLAFRFFNVFGPWQPAGHAYAAVIPAFVDAASRSIPLPVYGDGTQTRDFTYVGTLVELIHDALERRVTFGTPVNLAFGSRTSLNGVIELLEGIMGHPLEVDHRPPRVADVPHSQADDSLLRSLFPGVEPTPLRHGLEATVTWFRDQASASSPMASS